MEIIHDDLWFCQDCLVIAVNGDYTGLDDYDNAGERMAEINAGFERLTEEWGPHLAPNFDSETEDGIRDFSSRSCDCCGDWHAGSRHRFAVLG